MNFTSAFPDPPAYYKEFTAFHNKKPPPVITGTYEMFGITYSVVLTNLD